MFERYTEKARRVIFFARYEASHYGSPQIESEHLLLGLLRENASLGHWIPDGQRETIRKWIDAQTPQRPRISTSVDLPLSEESKKILETAASEADGLGHHTIGTDHLFLALFALKDCLAAKLLQQAGANIEKVRGAMPGKYEYEESHLQESRLKKAIRLRLKKRVRSIDTVEVHGSKWNAEYIRDVVSTVRSYNWHWHKTVWKPRDIVIHRESGAFSFELHLAEDTETFALIKQGWKKDHCFVCKWELFECDDEHGIGYTNGRHWLCLECCERFIQKDFFSSSQPEIT
jgi:hypothetical protein